MHPMLNIAVRAVRKAGDLIAKYYEKPDNIEIRKDNNDFLTNIDKVSEMTIIRIIRKSYPQHTIISNRIKQKYTDQDIQWVINPLDSTINFSKRLPHFAVSIAVRIKGRTEVAVVYDSMRNELFTATRGQGAQLNGYRLRGSTVRDLDGAILATAFSFKRQHTTIYMNILSKLFNECTDFRRSGSSTLDLAYVAAGRVDGYLGDFSDSELIARESGALVCDLTDGCYNHIMTGNIIAGNPRIVKAIMQICVTS